MDPEALKSDLIIMKSILKKYTGQSQIGKKKEVKQSSVERGRHSGSGGDESIGSSNDKNGDINYDGDGVGGGMKEGKKEERIERVEKVEKVEKEVVRQCLSSKCLVEQLPNTLSVSFKGTSLFLFLLLSFILSSTSFFLPVNLFYYFIIFRLSFPLLTILVSHCM